MDQQQALGVLIQAVNLAQSRGAYNLQEASVAADAVTVFTPPEQEGDSDTVNTETTEAETPSD